MSSNALALSYAGIRLSESLNSPTVGERATLTCGTPLTIRVMECGIKVTINLECDERPPAWLRPATYKLARLLALPQNWDSYGARPVDRQYVEFALEKLLPAIMEDGTFFPEVVPTKRGGIQFEWHMCGIDLEVEILSPENVRISYEKLDAPEEEWEEAITSDFERLAEIVRTQLSRYD